MPLSLVTYNIQYGIGMDGKYDLGRIVAAVREADVIALQEISRNSPWNAGADVEAGVRALFPDRFIVCHYPADVDFGSAIVNGEFVEKRFQFGNMVVSRFPIVAVRTHLLPRTARADQLNLQRGALEALIAAPQGFFRLYSVHLDHIDPAERLAQVQALKAIATGYEKTGGAISGLAALGFPELPATPDFILMGDFNFGPQSQEMAAMTGDGQTVDISASDPRLSYFDPKGVEADQRLDYCFANPEFAARFNRASVDVEAQGSDHRPVWVFAD
jgi:endonuclease/exonuclease/phosphatase family metal-dependent hydrolase